MGHIRKHYMSSAALTGLVPNPARMRALRMDAGESKVTIQDVVDAQKAAAASLQTFREANDERLDALEKQGKDDVVWRDKVDKANKDVDVKLEAISDTVTKLNLQVSRAAVGGQGGGDIDIKAAARQFTVNLVNARGDKLRPSEIDAKVDVDEYLLYTRAFNDLIYVGGNINAVRDPELRNALSVGLDPAGGYAVPPEQAAEFETRIFETSPMRQVATVRTIGVDAWEQPKDVEEGISGGWVGEKQARPATDTPEIGIQRIDVHEQYAFPQVTQKMLEDAVRLDPAGWVESKSQDKMVRTENAAFVAGPGVNQPRGFLDYGQSATTEDDKAPRPWGVLQYVPSGAAGAFPSTNPGDPLINMVHALKGAYRAGASWMMNRLTQAEVRKLKDGQGNYLWSMGNIQTGMPTTLMGFGLVEADDMPDIAADSFSIAFGNWSVGYTIIDRLGLFMIVDNLTNKPFVGFYMRRRVGGDVTNFDAIKLFKFATS